MLTDVFDIRVPVTELVLRGSLVCWLLFVIFRFILRRDVGAVGIADILLLVIIADASQNARCRRAPRPPTSACAENRR